MSQRYEDVIRQMERNGDYSSAREYKDALRESHISERDRVDRFNPADGAQHTHAGDQAERAYRDLRHEESRAEEREQERQQEESAQHRRWQESQRQEEEVNYAEE